MFGENVYKRRWDPNSVIVLVPGTQDVAFKTSTYYTIYVRHNVNYVISVTGSFDDI